MVQSLTSQEVSDTSSGLGGGRKKIDRTRGGSRQQGKRCVTKSNISRQS